MAQDWLLKPSLAQLLDRISEKPVLAHIKGSQMKKKKKIFWPNSKFFFILRSPRTTRNNRSSPHNGPIKKNFSLKSYYLCITNKEMTQIPKSESKKFSIMCTFKGAQVWDFRPIFFYTNKSYMGRWLEDCRKKKNFWKTTADIRHFVFFTQAEPALKNCLRRLSLR